MSSGDRPIPLIIGGSSSIAAKILCNVLGPLSVPLVSSIKIPKVISVCFQGKLELKQDKFFTQNINIWFSLCETLFGLTFTLLNITFIGFLNHFDGLWCVNSVSYIIHVILAVHFKHRIIRKMIFSVLNEPNTMNTSCFCL